MSNENLTLTEEQAREFARTVDEMATDDQKMIASLPSNNGVVLADENFVDELPEEEVMVNINPVTGELTSSPVGEMSEVDRRLAEMLEISLEELDKIPESVNDLEIPDELLVNAGTLKGFDESTMLNLIPVLKEYRSKSNDETIDWYEKLPLLIQTLIQKECAQAGQTGSKARNMLAECLIQELVQDATLDKVNIDFQQSMQKALDLSPIIEMSIDQQKTDFEINILEKAKQFREQGKIEAAEKVEKVSEAFRQSYLLEQFIEESKTGKLRVKKFDIEKIHRFIREFNYKYEGDTPFIIHNIANILPVLYRRFSHKYSDEDIQRFVIAFVKYTRNMSAHDVVDHTFMSYVISNILKLDLIVKSENQDNFVNSFIENLDKAIQAAKDGSEVK